VRVSTCPTRSATFTRSSTWSATSDTERGPKAAVLLGLSRAKAYESVRRGQLRSISFRRRIVIPAGVIAEILAGDDNSPSR